MTVFGRDSLLTAWMALLLDPALALGTLRTLARFQGTEVEPRSDQEPGKILHEMRFGMDSARSLAGGTVYYGSIDASPLFVMLLGEAALWGADPAAVAGLLPAADQTLAWIEIHGDRDGDGFVEYERRTDHGLENQSWKDSWDSQRFHDGTLAQAPIAPCEVQGYVYDAKRRVAELAREVWRDRELATRLDQEAEELRKRFDEAFWVEDRGGFYALALDGEKRKVDSLCSNIGHLLWSGIVPPARVDAVVDQLMGDELWSGWGVRTMSTGDAGYNPLSYHNGTVWPHDNSIIAAGLARYARWPEAQRVIQRMLTAAQHFNYQLPEVFAGMRRSETPFPIAYPTAARPQAWAAGTPVLLLQALLGLQPDRRRHALETVAPPELPSWAGSIRLSGIRAFGTLWDARLEDGRVRVDAA
jgi:glycogen debranching enzyme